MDQNLLQVRRFLLPGFDQNPGLTDAERQVEETQTDVQPEEQDDVGHFTEQDDVPDVLLHRD